MTPSFLVGLRLEGRQALVVGSGGDAVERARALLDAGAHVTLCTPGLDAEVQAFAENADVTVCTGPVPDASIDAAFLTVLVDRDPALAERLGAHAQRHQRLFCAVDQPAENSFHHVAILREGPLSIGIASAGSAPALARRLREELSRVFAAAGLGEFAQRLAALRQRLPPAKRAERLTQLLSELRLSGSLTLPRLDDDREE
ncbi:MAG: NAD(P)-dependent oxidoreductase [Polyangiaceae bacterium]